MPATTTRQSARSSAGRAAMQPVQARHPDVVDADRLAPEHPRRQCRLGRDGSVGRAGREHGDRAARHRQPPHGDRRTVDQQLVVRPPQRLDRVGGSARHEHRPVALRAERLDHLEHLRRRLARPVDDLGVARAQRPVHVDERVRQLVVRRGRQLVERVGRVQAALGDGLEERLRPVPVHGRSVRGSPSLGPCRPSPSPWWPPASRSSRCSSSWRWPCRWVGCAARTTRWCWATRRRRSRQRSPGTPTR